MTADDWHREAACKGRTDTFYRPIGPDGSVLKGSTWTPLAAQRICAVCPVARECLDYAIEGRELTGIWAGAGGDILRWLHRACMASDHDPNVEVCECTYCAAATDHLGRLAALRDPTVNRMPTAPPRVTDAATHGRPVTYNRGCRCARCRFSRTPEGTRLRRAGIDLTVWWSWTFGTGSGLSTDPPTADAEVIAARTLTTEMLPSAGDAEGRAA